MRRASQVDANQKDLDKAARDLGASIIPLHTVGYGVPDRCYGFQGRTYLVEIKVKGGTLSPAQKKFHTLWRGAPIHVCRNVDQLITLLTTGTK